MRWLRFYSLLLAIVSILIILLSFYIVDILPFLYKVYIGVEIPSIKMNKLILFGSKIEYELKLYSLLLFVSASIFYFIDTLKRYFIVLILLLLFHFLFIAGIVEFFAFKRFYKLLIMLPLLWIFFDYFKFKKESYQNKITNAFLYMTLLCIILPGLYLPPFFSGIQGWTLEIDKTKPFPIEGVFLVHNDGEEIRYSRAIVNPINFLVRLNTYMLRAYPEKVDELLKFYKNTYIKRYDLLKIGQIPSQKYLGKFAYPTHNPVGSFDYSKFPPNIILGIKSFYVKRYWQERHGNEYFREFQ